MPVRVKNFPIGKNSPCAASEDRPIFPIGKMDRIMNATQFGLEIARARRSLGLTQRELALAINSGERFVIELEAGKPTAQLGKALAAANAVGLRLTF